MRDCAICHADGKRVIYNHYDGDLCLFECTECGFRYVDGLVTQADFDKFYLTDYRTDDAQWSDARLNNLADFIARRATDVLDIGGMDGELQKRLIGRGVACAVAGVGTTTSRHECVVLSHTLEHIYDIDAMFERIDCDWLVIEVPVHLEYVEPLEYDYHHQHINKFRPQDLEILFRQKGYNVEISERIDDYREYKVWRIAGRYEGK